MTSSAVSPDVRRRLGHRRHPHPRTGRGRTGGDARRRSRPEFLAIAGVQTVSITGKDAETALEAFARYGKGQRHPAQLNMGDCFAYAVAKSYRTPLLFKGDDFTQTDISPPGG